MRRAPWLLAALLAGCAAKVAAPAAAVDSLVQARRAAEAGDAAAQYKVGAALCCGDPEAATAYLCRAAAQDFAPAQSLLGRLYDGQMAPGGKQEAALAVMWLTLAARQNDAAAQAALTAAKAHASAMDQQAGERLLDDWRHVPCRWSEVFPR